MNLSGKVALVTGAGSGSMARPPSFAAKQNKAKGRPVNIPPL
ncbi:hypothetical protein [Ktedonospora formicarum]|nr:hypothetical protein [Ktedonospora formicarum]